MALISNHKYSESMNGEWKVAVNPEPWGFAVKVYIAQRVGNSTKIVSIKDGNFELSDITDGINPPATLTLPLGVWQLLVDAINETTPATKKEVVDAELKATQYHLEDFRKLIFKEKK